MYIKDMSAHILLINGPNLNLLGQREPEIYGHEKLQDVEDRVRALAESAGLGLISFQSNQEGALIDFIQAHQSADFAIVNAGAFTHSSIALRDALIGVDMRFVEVHISNVHRREDFRKHSYLSDIASGVIVGCGVLGYELATRYILDQLRQG